MRLLTMALLSVWAISGLAADIILCGSGGTDEYDEQFKDWALRLEKVLVDQYKRDASQVHVLLAKPDQEHADRALSQTRLETLFQNLKTTHSDQEPLFVYMIGHGSHLRQDAKFQMPGPDLTATQLKTLLAGVPASQKVVINGSSASAGFINVLSGEQTVVCTATKSSREVNATEFMGHLVTALEGDLADKDGDKKISVYEACWRAASLTENGYTVQGLIATEHAIFDDNGDGLGSRLFQAENPEQQKDGLLAQMVFIKDFQYPKQVPKALIVAYEKHLEGVRKLKQQKASLPRSTYKRQLEQLLIQAARANQKIHQFLPKSEDTSVE